MSGRWNLATAVRALCLRLTPEQEEKLSQIRQVIDEERIMFGLADWCFTVWFASGDLLQKMREKGDIARVFSHYGRDVKRIDVFFDEELLAKTLEEDLRTICDHEWAHIIVNPYEPTAYTDDQLEETQVTRIMCACKMLRLNAGSMVQDENDLEDIIIEAFVLTLNEPNWQVGVGWKKIERFGKRLPAFAYAPSAREIILELDEEFIKQKGLCLADVVLKALWRLVLNPYGAPEDVSFNIQERQLGHIMKAMKALGW